MRVLICSNTFWYIYNFRRKLIARLRKEGMEVFLAAAHDEYAQKLEGVGVKCIDLKLSASGINPFKEFGSLMEIGALMRRESINVVFSYTSKLNIYSSLASIYSKTVVYPNVSGLGRVFIRRSYLTKVVSFLYWLAFRHVKRVFFQNAEDASLFLTLGIVNREQIETIPGSGVDLVRFSSAVSGEAGQARHSPFVFLMAARVLWDKGVGEFADAAREVKRSFADVEFHLLGFVDVDNPAAVGAEQVRMWEQEGVLTYLGATDDVLPFLRSADCVVLPSYREGCPRVLLEAAACEKVVITTDVPGCRDVVEHGTTGLLCKLKDSKDLADKMRAVLVMADLDFRDMGKRAREKMVREFDERFVLDKYMAVLK